MTDSSNTTFYDFIKNDGLVKSRILHSSVIPAEAGIQQIQELVDAGSSPA